MATTRSFANGSIYFDLFLEPLHCDSCGLKRVCTGHITTTTLYPSSSDLAREQLVTAEQNQLSVVGI
jgi:hypothetical protein